ncbi:MAG: hypothetical protein AAFR39_13215 [Pseudomonadota bacterium]
MKTTTFIAALGATALLTTAFAQEIGTEGTTVDSNPPDDSPVRQGFGGAGFGGADMFVFINSNGTKARGKGDLNASKIDTGEYEVTFWRNIRDCNYQATIGSADTSTAIGFITVARRSGKSNGVFVRTYSPGGVLSDRPFSVYVNC